MNILGPDTLVFGVDDVAACERFLIDYGLQATGKGRFEALDGTGVEIRRRDDPALPKWDLTTANMLRKSIYGVRDASVLEQIKHEFEGEREVKVFSDGSLELVDDLGFTLGFQVTVRRPLDLPAEVVNAPGDIRRAANITGVPSGVATAIVARPRTLSHVVYFVPDSDKAEAFYTRRLGFKLTDKFIGMGPFLRPAGTADHHTLFFIQTPAHLQGCEHFTFHMGATEVLSAGYAFVAKGYESFWGADDTGLVLTGSGISKHHWVAT